MLPLARNDSAWKRCAALVAAALVCLGLNGLLQRCAKAQAPVAAAPGDLPEPILWKQSRFLIPYQWANAVDQSSTKSVRLFISKDLGQSWQPISEAQPHLRGFTYHAEQDGEFWFSIRTIDSLGRAWPNEAHRPELRVIVDTTFPEIQALGGTLNQNGLVEIFWSASDARLDVESIKIEVQVDGSGSWQPVALPPQYVGPGGVSQGRAQWQLAPNTPKVVLRAEVYDKAGNRSFRGAEIVQGESTSPATNQYPTMVIGRDELPPSAASSSYPDTNSSPAAGGYPQTAASDPFALQPQPGSLPPMSAATPQGWQAADITAQSGASSSAVRNSQPWPADLHASQSPNSTSTTPGFGNSTDSATYQPPPTNSLPYHAPSNDLSSRPEAGRDDATGYGLIEPYRTGTQLHSATANSTPARSVSNSSVVREQPLAALAGSSESSSTWKSTGPSAWVAKYGVNLPSDTTPMMVGLRTFDLDYALEEIGNWGVSRVELWGTRDGGRTWRQYALDDDNRSPIRVTVEGEGIYGFRIVAQSPGGPGPAPPQSGDQPELWVGVDLEPPRAELLAVEQGAGNLADHLIVRWRADDMNLDRRPIALFYSSRAGGPWSAVATGLENTGEYAWRLERHLPSHFYLRLEARDTSGNLTTYQTSQPIALNRAQPSAQLRGVRPPGNASEVVPVR